MTSGSEFIVLDGETHFSVKGTVFEVISKDYNLHKTDGDRVVILKGPTFLATYDAVLASAPTKNALELGVFEGGSLIYLALAFPDFRFVGVDIRNPSEALAARIRSLGLQDRVKIYYNVSQADVEAVSRIVADEFGKEPVGTIIDDASHNYNLSKKSFELTFGHLEPGGTYCLEDWAWAHWGEPFQTTQWIDHPALTNLVFEFAMLVGTTGSQLIKTLSILPQVVMLTRGPGWPGTNIDINSMLRLRGKSLSLI